MIPIILATPEALSMRPGRPVLLEFPLAQDRHEYVYACRCGWLSDPLDTASRLEQQGCARCFTMEPVAGRRREYLVRLSAVTLLVLALTGCGVTGARRTAQVAFLGAQTLDLHSTHQVLAQGGRELNPMLPSSGTGQIAVKAAESAAILWLGERLAKDHPKLAAVLTAAIAATYGLIAKRNYELARKD